MKIAKMSTSSPKPKPAILFAGLGAMGYGMATHLLRCGFSVIGYDVYEPSMLKLAAEGGGSANTPRQAAKDVDIMIVMVANQAQATPLLFNAETGAAGGLRAGATVLMCSTVAPAYTSEIERRLKALGRGDVKLVDAPVSGGAARAAQGTLSIFSSGDDAAVSAPHVRSILACLSDERKLYHVPGGLGAGSKAKLIHQILAGVHIAMASEAMGLAAAAGLDTRAAFEALREGQGRSWMFGNRVPFMLDPGLGRYSAVTIIAKDVGIVSVAAREEGFPLPLTGTAERLYASAIEKGWGAEDDCVLVRLYLPSRPKLVMERAGVAAMAVASDDGAGVSGGVGVRDIEDLMVGVHLAALSEAMAFCERLGIDTDLMFDIVSNAAGASQVFEEYFGVVRGNGWGLNGMEGVGESLTKAIAKARALRYPLFLSSAALQKFPSKDEVA